jgi:cytochrome c oxidase subunit IV
LNKKKEEKENEIEKAKKIALGEFISVKEYKGPKKSFKGDILIISLIFALCPLVVLLGVFYVERYLTFSIIFGLMLLTGGVFLTLRLKDLMKMVSLIEKGEVDSVSQLMNVMKKKNKQDFLKIVREMIISGHLVGFEIKDGEHFQKNSEEEVDK